MSWPWQLEDEETLVGSSGYTDNDAVIYQQGLEAGVQLLSNWFRDRQADDLTKYRGQVSRVYSDLDYQMKWINDQINGLEV